jgi:hypothetical protein
MVRANAVENLEACHHAYPIVLQSARSIGVKVKAKNHQPVPVPPKRRPEEVATPSETVKF